MVHAFYTLVAVAVTGAVITTLQAVMTLMFRRRRRFFGEGLPRQARFSRPVAFSREPFVSILKPVCGLEDDLEGNLLSFVSIRDIRHEVILSVATADDPAVAVIERVRRRHPAAPFRLVIGGDLRLEIGNRKVARLIAAQDHARGDILVISDANVRIEPDDLHRTIEAFRDPRVGCVSNLFTGAGAANRGAVIESLHLLGFVVPGNVLAAFAGVPCVVGKSMAISRRALDTIGGFRRFARVLAEDQAIGLAVRSAGFRVELSPVVVRNVVVERTVRRALDRQVRWNKIRYAFSKRLYSAEFLVNPLPFALMAGVLGLTSFGVVALAIPAATAAVRIAQMAVLNRAMSASLRRRDLLLVPLLDLLQFGAQFVPYVSDRVTWRGYTARIGPNTELTDLVAA